MPIEIKELHIKATVIDKKTGPAVQVQDLNRDREKLKRDLLKECVQEVLQILEDKKER